VPPVIQMLGAVRHDSRDRSHVCLDRDSAGHAADLGHLFYDQHGIKK